ncbi:sensor histidine kinase [Sphingomonas sp.]|uniref:sensor histidine kinase n=1 Tax=Sphingomonas sp. TaxID=28214 RepID=UPI003BAD45CD
MVARDQVPCLAENVLTSTDPMTAFIRAVGLDSYACTPLIHGETLIGTLGFGRRASEPFSDAELQFLRTICSYVAVARNRLDVQAEMMATIQAHETLAAEQARLIERLSAQPANTDLTMIAHEIAQPLSAASNYIVVVQRALEGLGGATGLAELSHARAEIDRCSQIVARMRRLLQSGEINAEFNSVQWLFEDALRLVLSGRPNAESIVTVDVGAGVSDILGDRVQLAQVVANLVRNAIQAVATHCAPQVTLRARAAGDWAEISVEDNGPGFAAGTFPEPGVSTTSGSGVGLSVVKRILAAHDSDVWLGKAVSGGACVTFRLLRRDAAVGVAGAAERALVRPD